MKHLDDNNKRYILMYFETIILAIPEKFLECGETK